MGFDIKLLGTFEASVGGVSFVSSASKQRQVLAVLTVNSGRTIPMSRLTEELWGTTPPRSSSTTIHTYIGKVRRALDLALHDDPRLEGKDVLATDGAGYRLNVAREDIDINRYDRLAAAGRRAVENGDFVNAARELKAALALWRGSAISDIAHGPLLMVETVRLEESRLSILDLRIEVELRLGRHRELLAELAGLCARFPMSENFYAQYMLALCRSGQLWRALEVFQRLRVTMVDQLGVDPSAKMRQLHQAILCGHPAVQNLNFATSHSTTSDILAG
jgi:DNA-binding SARP family transcriptional activator